MALVEQTLAEQLVDLRLAMSTGTEYVRADDLERALQHHLDREQWWRTEIRRVISDADNPRGLS